MSIILKNGVVFDGFALGTEREDILVKDGVVARRGADLAEEGARVIDCAGRIVCPGFIDLHAHFRDPGFEWREDITSGARAAAAGGHEPPLARSHRTIRCHQHHPCGSPSSGLLIHPNQAPAQTAAPDTNRGGTPPHIPNPPCCTSLLKITKNSACSPPPPPTPPARPGSASKPSATNSTKPSNLAS